MDQIARLNIIKFVQEVGGKGSNMPIPGFKDIALDKLGDIIESIESKSNTFGFKTRLTKIDFNKLFQTLLETYQLITQKN